MWYFLSEKMGLNFAFEEKKAKIQGGPFRLFVLEHIYYSDGFMSF